MAKLHQILAAHTGAENETKRLTALAAQGLGVAGEQSPLSGISRTYEPRQDGGDQLPGKYQHVQISVEKQVMPIIREAFTKLLDLKYTRDEANTQARADVRVDGNVLLAGVPTTYLMTLEYSLGELRKSLDALPVLDPAKEWRSPGQDGNESAWYATRPQVTEKMEPVPQVHVLYEAKIEGGVGLPAQVQAYTTSRPVGDWTEVKFSGCIPASDKEAMLRRLAKLQEAVKFAREHANRIDAPAQEAGKALFDYVYGEG